MIDKNKIKSAAQGYCDATYGTLNTDPFIAEAFRKGANWAINEFLKDLWHPAEEEPKKNRLVLTDTRSIMDKDYICWTTVKLTENGFVRNWSNYAKVTKITRWLYLDDLFLKEGGKFKVGERKTISLVAIESDKCEGCYFYDKNSCNVRGKFECIEKYRSDHKNVIFKEVKE